MSTLSLPKAKDQPRAVGVAPGKKRKRVGAHPKIRRVQQLAPVDGGAAETGDAAHLVPSTPSKDDDGSSSCSTGSESVIVNAGTSNDEDEADDDTDGVSSSAATSDSDDAYEGETDSEDDDV